MADPQGITIGELLPASALDGTEFMEVEQNGQSFHIRTSDLFSAGTDGKSAYELAVDGGYSGTQTEWIASLNGTDGLDGDKGDNGTNGANGKSAFELAQAGGYPGTEAQWLASLKGAKGDKGDKGDLGVGIRLLGSVPDEASLPPPEESGEGDCFLIDSAFWAFNGSFWANLGDIGGPDGKSAYDLAVLAGFEGTEEDWLISLHGSDGIGLVILGSRNSVGELPATGNSNGDSYIVQEQMWVWDGDSFAPVGQVGPAGKSAYQLAVAGGFQGTQPEWIASLKGAKGDKGDKGDTGDTGPQGLPAAAVRVLGQLTLPSELPATGNAPGDAYFVGLDLWYWQNTAWANYGPLRGEQGDQGIQGLKGDKGDTGNTGAQGSSIEAKGTVATQSALPAPTVLNKGHMYSALDTSVVYISDGTIWVGYGAMRGVQGIQGLKGDKGDQGQGLTPMGTVANQAALPAAAPGNSGWIYNTQDNGHQWISSGAAWVDHGDLRGIQGPIGNTGIQGDPGLKGDPGTGLTAKGSAANFAALPAPSAGNLGWVYNLVDTGHQWISNGAAWVDQGDLRGIQGVKGTDGAKGDTGNQGPAGPPINLKGAVATVGALPGGAAVGDSYTVTADGHLYTWNGSVWVDGGQFQGPKGDQGIQGVKGDKGDTGAGLVAKGTVANSAALPAAGAGNNGWVYQTADTYHMWISNGVAWVDQGDFRGAQGIQGVKGDTGNTGNTGTAGAPGNALKFLGFKANQAALPASGNTQADAWTLLDTNHMWIYNGTAFVDGGLQTGPSAYQLAVAGGFVGSQAAWIASLQGAKGDQGVQGLQGDQGIQGIQGDIGPEGPQGPVGPGLTILGKLASTGDLPGSGTLGQGYIIGLNFWVWTGSAYEDMGPVQGPKGDRGFQGVQGIQGVAGIQGVKGDTGQRGSIWIALNRAPGPVDGVIDDFFINTTDNTYFKKTTSTAWLALGNLGAGNVFDAPSDGVKRVRQDGAWVTLVFPVNEAPQDNGYYFRRNAAWVAFQMAPSDGTYYAYRNGAWTALPAPTGSADLTRALFAVTAATTTLDLAVSQVFTVSAAAARTLAFANAPGAGKAMTVVVSVAGNAFGITWPAGISWSGGSQPVLGASFTNVILLWNGTNWTGSAGATA